MPITTSNINKIPALPGSTWSCPYVINQYPGRSQIKEKIKTIKIVLEKISLLYPDTTWPSGNKVAIKTKRPPIMIKTEVPKLTSSSLLILIKVAQTDHNMPEIIPKRSARDCGKKFPWSNPVIINRPENPAVIDKKR